MSYKNYKWDVFVKDVNSPFLRNYIWTKCFFTYPKLLKIPRLVIGITSDRNKIDYIVDFNSLSKCHEELKSKQEKDSNFIEELINKSNQFGEEFNKWTENNIFNVNVSKLTTKQMIDLLNEFVEKQGRLYAFGVALPVLDLQNFNFVEGNLVHFLEEKVSKKDFQKYFTVFTYPSHSSFSQNQEESLLKLMEEFYDDQKWRKDVLDKSLEELKDKYPKFYNKLEEHTKKYCWVYYVYVGPAFTEENFLTFIRDYLTKNINPTEKLKYFEDKKNKNKKLKDDYIKELQPDNFQRIIINLAGKIVWAKPRRKDYQSKSYYHLEKLMKEISKRLYLTLDQTLSIPLDILGNFLEKGKVDVDLVNSIYQNHAILPNDDGTITILKGKEAKEFIENKVSREDQNEDISDLLELTGTCACSGKVQGIVKVINLPEEMDKMNDSDILVSVATTPSIVLAMKKASAILTDEGGLTCHASIVSRELNTPCIVGLKVVTKFLKDGDKVEVDANEGIVRRI